MALRWPDGQVSCPRCGSENVTYLENAKVWKCYAKHPKAKFSVKVGSLMEDSPIGLDKWLCAIWLIANAKNGISSLELHRSLGITQKSAWFLLHRIRKSMQNKSAGKLSGVVEVDETFIGGAARNMHKGKRKAKGTGFEGKMAVMGLLERHGEVRTVVVGGTKRSELQPNIKTHVEYGSVVYRTCLSRIEGLKVIIFTLSSTMPKST